MVLDQVMSIRNVETKFIFKENIISSIDDFFGNIIPVFMCVGMFGVYAIEGNILTP